MPNKPVTAILFICFIEANLVAYFTLINCWHSAEMTMIVHKLVAALKWYHNFLCVTLQQIYLLLCTK